MRWDGWLEHEGSRGRWVIDLESFMGLVIAFFVVNVSRILCDRWVWKSWTRGALLHGCALRSNVALYGAWGMIHRCLTWTRLREASHCLFSLYLRQPSQYSNASLPNPAVNTPLPPWVLVVYLMGWDRSILPVPSISIHFNCPDPNPQAKPQRTQLPHGVILTTSLSLALSHLASTFCSPSPFHLTQASALPCPHTSDMNNRPSEKLCAWTNPSWDGNTSVYLFVSHPITVRFSRQKGVAIREVNCNCPSLVRSLARSIGEAGFIKAWIYRHGVWSINHCPFLWIWFSGVTWSNIGSYLRSYPVSKWQNSRRM